jgi:CHAT domain-containing protein
MAYAGTFDASQVQQHNSPSELVDAALLEGKRLRDTGHVSEAIATYSRAVTLSRNAKDSEREAKSFILLSVAQNILFQYSAALTSSEQGLAAASRAGNMVLQGSANGNISTVYSQLGDLEAARLAATKAVDCFRSAAGQPKVNDFLARALANRASINFLQNRNAEGYQDSAEAISLATASGDLRLQATVWEARGFALMREDKVSESQNALETEFAIRQKLNDLSGLAVTKEHLAELEIRKSNPNCQTALRLMDEAFAVPSNAFKANAQYYPIHIRAKILLQCGEKLKALDEFKRAVNEATQWRRGALPGDLTSTRTVASLQDVYGDYAQLAAQISLETHNKQMSYDALEALAENRAASLRDQLRLARSRNLQVPDTYYFKLSQLQAAQAQVTLGRNSKEDKLSLLQIRSEIADLENRNGITEEKLRTQKEKNPRRNSLKNIQTTLNRDQVLLTLSLGKNKSYLWAVTEDQVYLTEIAKESELKSAATSFAASVRDGRSSPASASLLSRSLFGNLPKQYWQKPEWLLVADGPLLNGIPFCALPDLSSDKNLNLIANHNLRFLPSELLLLAPRTNAAPREFVGIGDPIYNEADSRLIHNAAADAKSITPGVSLARLVGSDKEIRSAAQESHAPVTTLLTGQRATRESLQTAIQTTAAAFVHFAVHVVSPPGQPQEAALALSLKNGMPELLTSEVIESFRLPGSLVVLSGCSSDQGKTLPGAGLLGLSRAWLVAGASAVIVSSWPTPDDSGKFFSTFYRHLDEIKSGSIAQRAAQALRQTQNDMMRSSGYRTSPTFWSAFTVVSKE